MSAIDMYTCPEPDCDFIVGAAGPMGADEYDQFAEEVREHKRRHEPVDSATHASSSQAGLASLIPSDGAVTQPNPAPSDDATHHGIDIRFDGDDERPSIYFRCDAPATALCHAVYDCSCESWHSEEMVDGVPQHRDSDDEVHTGRFIDECRLDDWFDNSDEVLSGDVTIPIRPEWVGDFYVFHVGGAR